MASEKEKRSEQVPAKVDRHPEALGKVATPSPRKEGEVVEGMDSLNQLREILFGAVHRDLERRLARADAHLGARAHELEQESRRRTEVVEAHLRKETDALTSRVERELTELGDTVRALMREHREAMTALEQRVGKAETSIGQAQRELRAQLL